MKQSKITFFTSVGAGLEYYDLVIYSLLADSISRQFFPIEHRVVALFATFGIFVLGNLVRPLGGIIFGILGDRFGRKNVFANTLLWMALATFLMGLTPTFATLGLAATIIFSFFRVMQGLAFGAELPGALTFLSEHIDKKRIGLHFGFLISAVSLGVSLGSFVTWVLAKILTADQILEWGFRIPFLLGGGLALVGFYIRKHIPETPVFLAMKKKRKSKAVGVLIKDHLWQAINIIGILLCPVCFITFQLVFPVYLHDFYHFSYVDIYLAMTCGYVWSAVVLPAFGWVSDYVGRKPLIVVAALIMILAIYPAFYFLQQGSSWVLFGFMIFTHTIMAAMSASYFVLLPQAFQTAIRYTGTAFSYNIAYMIAAMIPLVVNYFYGVLKDPRYIIWIFISLAIITVINVIMFRVKHDNFSA